MLYGIGCDLCEIAHLEKALPAHTLQPLSAGCTVRPNALR